MYASKKAQQSEKMRAHLIAKARKLFETKGFDGVSAEEIVGAAGVTRGALYHHFGGKEGLFSAVAEAAMDQLHQNIARDASNAGSSRDRLSAAIRSFLVRTDDRHLRQLLFVDAPAVLGWADWRACDEKFGLGALIVLIEQGSAEGQFRTKQPKISAHLLLSAMIEGALVIASNPKDRKVRTAVEDGLNNWVAAI